MEIEIIKYNPGIFKTRLGFFVPKISTFFIEKNSEVDDGQEIKKWLEKYGLKDINFSKVWEASKKDNEIVLANVLTEKELKVSLA